MLTDDPSILDVLALGVLGSIAWTLLVTYVCTRFATKQQRSAAARAMEWDDD